MTEKTNFKNSVICVYKDKKSGLYTAPLIFDNEECALRHFDNLSLKDANVCDYDLYLLGFYNNQFGEIELLTNGEKYLLRGGDYYYDYITKLKDFTNTALNLKTKYREEYVKVLDFAKTLYNELFSGYNEETFCMIMGDFEDKYNKETFKVGDYNVKK